MKRTLKLFSILICVAAIAYGGITLQSAYAQDRVEKAEMDQINIVENVVTDLQKEGIPIVFNKINMDADNEISPIVECILQSSSVGDKPSQDDPIYLNVILHELNMAQNVGLDIGGINISLLNARGDELFNFTQAASPDALMVKPAISPVITTEQITELIKVNSNLYGMKLSHVKVINKGGFTRCILDLQVTDIDVANAIIPYFIADINNSILTLNVENSAQIALYQINVSTVGGETVLKYINDLQLRTRTWWQHEKAATDWFTSYTPNTIK
jgi:hypothetical protein